MFKNKYTFMLMAMLGILYCSGLAQAITVHSRPKQHIDIQSQMKTKVAEHATPPPSFPVVMYLSVDGAYIANAQTDSAGNTIANSDKFIHGVQIPHYFGYVVVDSDYKFTFVRKTPFQAWKDEDEIIERINEVEKDTLLCPPGYWEGCVPKASVEGLITSLVRFADYGVSIDYITFGIPPYDSFTPQYKESYMLTPDMYHDEIRLRPRGKMDPTIINLQPGMESIH